MQLGGKGTFIKGQTENSFENSSNNSSFMGNESDMSVEMRNEVN